MWVFLRDMESVATFDLYGDVHAQYWSRAPSALLQAGRWQSDDGHHGDPRDPTPLVGVGVSRLACSLFIADHVGVRVAALIIQRCGRRVETEVSKDFAVEGVVGIANQLGLIALTLTPAPA